MAAQALGKNTATGGKNINNDQIKDSSIHHQDRHQAVKVNLDPLNQNSDDENEWQSAPILRQYRKKTLSAYTAQTSGVRQNSAKRMRLSPTPSPEKIPTQNRYSELKVDEKQETMTKPRANKPPPLMLYGIKDVTKLKDLIEEVLNITQFSFKIVTKNQLRVTADSIEAYKNLMVLVREKKLIGHTFTPKDERPYRIVIKNLHPSTPMEAIKQAIESTGNIVKGEIINARHGQTKAPLSTWFVNIEPGPNNSEIKNLKYIYHTCVNIEDPKRKKTIPQCKRCQQYGHTKNYCMRPYRCVKCAENHNTLECPKTKDEPAKCALCLGEHAASYKGCKVFQEIQKRKSNSRVQTRPWIQMEEKDFPTIGNRPTLPEKPSTNTESAKTYAQAITGDSTNLEKIISKQAEKLDRLIDQMGTLMSLLTTIVNKLVR